ncbi:MAG: hypothetical protein M3O30_08975 [Planctomycetota bacterium]|nr:hypothetical protein [Planctomycetota bacterium]
MSLVRAWFEAADASAAAAQTRAIFWVSAALAARMIFVVLLMRRAVAEKGGAHCR